MSQEVELGVLVGRLEGRCTLDSLLAPGTGSRGREGGYLEWNF